MAIPRSLKPTTPRRVMDLVAEAGVDVSDWANFKGGSKRAASNPRYCYQWSFVEPSKVVVVNLWFEHLKQRNGSIYQVLEYRKLAEELQKSRQQPTTKRRAEAMDQAVKTAALEQLPVRVVMCDGRLRDREHGDPKPSQARRRLLDPIPWSVSRYDPKTGRCILVRGKIPGSFVDQFSLPSPGSDTPGKKALCGQAFVRSEAVRIAVLKRSRGECEYCKTPGFKLPDGRIYLETHHIVPLSERGKDRESNVVAICPNHHREAHLGASGDRMSVKLAKIVADKLRQRSE